MPLFYAAPFWPKISTLSVVVVERRYLSGSTYKFCDQITCWTILWFLFFIYFFIFFLYFYFLFFYFIYLFVYLFIYCSAAHRGPGPSSFTRFLDHTQRRTTVGSTPLDEWSARDSTQHSQQTDNHAPWRDSNPRCHQASGRRRTL